MRLAVSDISDVLMYFRICTHTLVACMYVLMKICVHLCLHTRIRMRICILFIIYIYIYKEDYGDYAVTMLSLQHLAPLRCP